MGLLAGLSRVCTVRVACESRPALLDSVRLSGKNVCVCVCACMCESFWSANKQIERSEIKFRSPEVSPDE